MVTPTVKTLTLISFQRLSLGSGLPSDTWFLQSLVDRFDAGCHLVVTGRQHEQCEAEKVAV